jgi:hypothetical protein
MTTTKHDRPTGTPIGSAATDTAARPTELTEDQLAIAHQAGGTATGTLTGTAMTASGQAAPMLHPPGTAGAAAATANLAGTWQTKQVLALYNTRASRTGWAYLDGVGWRRLATTNDSAHAALGALTSAARTSGATIVARDDADAQIHEIYLW